MCKENQNNNIIQQFVSSTSPYRAISESITYVNNICMRIRCLCFDLNVNNVSAYIHTYDPCCLWDSESSFIKNILIYVPKMNEGPTGLEQHEGEKLMSDFFLYTYRKYGNTHMGSERSLHMEPSPLPVLRDSSSEGLASDALLRPAAEGMEELDRVYSWTL